MQDKEDGHMFCLKNLFSIYQKMSSTEKRYLLGNLRYEYLKTRDKQRNGEKKIKMIACFDEQYH
jgi:hypothetical protein